MGDVLVVMWKEWREFFVQWGSMRGGGVGILLFLGVFGVYLPLQTGTAWVQMPALLLCWAWVPLFLTTAMIADSFAGERERRTLETLLASRLSDRAILLGKVGAGIAYGWGFTMLNLVIGLVVINIAYGGGRLLLYPPAIGGGIVGLSFLGSALAASGGALISLRSPTVRQAQQTLSVWLLVLAFLPYLGLRALPDAWQVAVVWAATTAGVTRVVVIALAALAVIDALLFAAAAARFKRSRLTLD